MKKDGLGKDDILNYISDFVIYSLPLLLMIVLNWYVFFDTSIISHYIFGWIGFLLLFFRIVEDAKNKNWL